MPPKQRSTSVPARRSRTRQARRARGQSDRHAQPKSPWRAVDGQRRWRWSRARRGRRWDGRLEHARPRRINRGPSGDRFRSRHKHPRFRDDPGRRSIARSTCRYGPGVLVFPAARSGVGCRSGRVSAHRNNAGLHHCRLWRKLPPFHYGGASGVATNTRTYVLRESQATQRGGRSPARQRSGRGPRLRAADGPMACLASFRPESDTSVERMASSRPPPSARRLSVVRLGSGGRGAGSRRTRARGYRRVAGRRLGRQRASARRRLGRQRAHAGRRLGR